VTLLGQEKHDVGIFNEEPFSRERVHGCVDELRNIDRFGREEEVRSLGGPDLIPDSDHVLSSSGRELYIIMDRIPLFRLLEIETHSECNRKCVTCLRNSIPDRESVASWFESNSLSIDDIKRVLEQSIALGFAGEVCLSHYNEPLMDDRIVDIVMLVKSLGLRKKIFFGSNGDFLTEDLAKRLDGNVNYIGFALYMGEPVLSKRIAWIRSLFNKTQITIGPGAPEVQHMATHFSPVFDLVQLRQKHENNVCIRPQKRLIVNHMGQMLLCCDDLTGNFDLGTIHESTVEELWYSEKHQNFVRELSKPGGRKVHSHCLSCPRD
jgi:radical SAM protein with 4Fe4S-binding SPASM domain